MKDDLIALFDMDDTLFDYRGSLRTELEKIRSPDESDIPLNFQEYPEYLRNRIRLITSSESFWSEMPKLQLGWNILKIAQELDYRIMILTQGPQKKPMAWSGKKRCIDKHFGETCDITLTRDKGLVYGKLLVDDFPAYGERWLKWRKRGHVIMPANDSNIGYQHLQVTRYDGTNLDEVRKIFQEMKDKTLAKQGPPEVIYL